MHKNANFAIRAIPFEILRGGGMEKKICGGCAKKLKYVRGVREKIKYVRGVGKKIKICEGGSAKFSISPPPIRISNGIALICFLPRMNQVNLSQPML